MTAKALLLPLMLAALASPLLHARQPGIPDHIYEPPLVLDEQEGIAALEAFRRQRLAGDFSFIFELRHMPRRGRTVTCPGRMIGTWRDGYPAFRVVLYPSGTIGTGEKIALLLVNNGQGIAWRLDSFADSENADGNHATHLLQDEQIHQPLIPGMVYTAFDLLMPYIYWDAFDYTGKQRLKSRNVHRYTMYPPKKNAKATQALHAVKLELDAEFNALIKAQAVGDDDKALKTFKVNRFKKVDEQYIVKELDLLDEASRDKTRFIVLEAALGLAFEEGAFKPEAIAEAMPYVDAARYVRTD